RALTVQGLGTLALMGTNTFAGGTTVNNFTPNVSSGTLLVGTGSNANGNSSVGSGTLTLTSGVLQAPATASLSFNNIVTLNATSPVAFTGGDKNTTIATATEAGTTVTITTTAPHGLIAGQQITIAGVGVAGYNGTFTVLATGLTATTFQYTNPTAGLA